MMILKDTIDMMNSSEYQQRFKAEYYQLVIRYYRLKEMLEECDNNKIEFTPTCLVALIICNLKLWLIILQFLKQEQ